MTECVSTLGPGRVISRDICMRAPGSLDRAGEVAACGISSGVAHHSLRTKYSQFNEGDGEEARETTLYTQHVTGARGINTETSSRRHADTRAARGVGLAPARLRPDSFLMGAQAKPCRGCLLARAYLDA